MNNRLSRGITAALALLYLPAGVFAADVDGDAVEDAVDNCLNVSNPAQRDTDADGFGNFCDGDFDNNLVVGFPDLGYMKAHFFGADPDADMDGDGAVSFSDLALLKQSFFDAPGPAGEDAVPGGPAPELVPELYLDSSAVCFRSFTHKVQAAWDVTPADSEMQVLVRAWTADGEEETHLDTASSGNVVFEFDEPFGGPLAATVEATDAGGQMRSAAAFTVLAPCSPPPVPDDEGFVPPPDFDPPLVGNPGADPNEVDVVHLIGSPNGPLPPLFVVGAGTGSGARLYSYTIDGGTTKPVHLKTTSPFAGVDIKLERLQSVLASTPSFTPFVAGVRREGNLWLRAWQVFGDGTMAPVGTRGYGENANVEVQAYAMATRELGDAHFQVVTPVRTQNDTLRTITWEIDNAGTVIGRQDSGDWGDPAADSELGIAHLEGNLYVVSYRHASGDMAQRYWDVTPSGYPSPRGGGVSGLTLRGTATVQQPIQGAMDLAIATDDFVTPLLDENGDFGLHVWETRQTGWDEGVIYSPYQISDDSRDQKPDDYGIDIQPLPGLTNATDGGGAFLANVRAMLTDGLIEDDFGVGSGELFEQFPNGELTSVHIASVTKNMSLLLAVEAIEDGLVTLNDVVTVSEGAAAVGGSQIGLAEGEEQTLETLLYGMMLRSGNDAAAAIAEYLAGTNENFLDLMNLRAAQLGMNDTQYGPLSTQEGAAAGSGVSNAQDQITLWMYAKDKPLFAQIASAKQYDDCGELQNGDPKCYFMDKFGDSGYPGLEGWKGGNGGFFVPGYSDSGGSFCVGSGCLVAQATRMDRDMIVSLQQSGNRWGDADTLFDYGYRLTHTPDRRGDEASGGLVYDFALDNVNDTLGVTADVDGFDSTVKVCTWTLFADLGQIDKADCDRLRVEGLAGGVDRAAPTQVDGTRISTLMVDGDFWTGYMKGGNLMRLHLWRVGPKQ